MLANIMGRNEEAVGQARAEGSLVQQLEDLSLRLDGGQIEFNSIFVVIQLPGLECLLCGCIREFGQSSITERRGKVLNMS